MPLSIKKDDDIQRSRVANLNFQDLCSPYTGSLVFRLKPVPSCNVESETIEKHGPDGGKRREKKKKEKWERLKRDEAREDYSASAGNRTRGPSMATTDFTTKPPMLVLLERVDNFHTIRLSDSDFARSRLIGWSGLKSKIEPGPKNRGMYRNFRKTGTGATRRTASFIESTEPPYIRKEFIRSSLARYVCISLAFSRKMYETKSEASPKTPDGIEAKPRA